MTRTKRTTVAIATTALLSAFGTATAQQGTAQPGQAQQGKAQQAQAGTARETKDGKFVIEAASGGMMEVALGRLAGERATSQEVKNFGQRMVQDHGQANTRLIQIAADRGITLPQKMITEHQKHYDQLARLSGADFDRQYMSHMLKDHQKDVKSFEQQAESGSDPSLKTFAQQTLPTLREHLQLAEQVAARVGVGQGKGAGSGH